MGIYKSFWLYICPFFEVTYENTEKEKYLYDLKYILAFRKISRVKLIIFSFFFHEFVMVAAFDDASLL